MDVDGNMLVTGCSSDRTLQVWELSSGRSLDTVVMKEATEISGVKICRGIIACLLQRKVVILNRFTRAKCCNLHIAGNGRVDYTSFALSKDYLAVGSGCGPFMWNFRLNTAVETVNHPVLKLHKVEIHLY
jgi:hypothetical protein